MIAIISDIHGNLEALEAVLADIAVFSVDDIYCLGDVIGYGPDSIACVERAMEWGMVLEGNFEVAATTFEAPIDWGMAVIAEDSVLRFRSELQKHHLCTALTSFLDSLPMCFETADALYVHGSPRNPWNEYLFPEDVHNERKMLAIHELFNSLCFCGHTHMPGIFRPVSAERFEFLAPKECGHHCFIGDQKLICNVGSVGQPRDEDPRACYVLYTPELITFRRVEYDIELTVSKIKDRGGFDFSGERLREGR